MILRTSGDIPSATGQRHRRLRLPAALAGMVLVLLTLLAGGSGAGVSNYQGTIYFSGPASLVSGSYLLTTATPGAQGAAPVAAAGVPNSGGVPTGAYKYVYATSSGGARTASVASNQVNVTNAPVTVTNVPVGADVYRAKVPAGTATGQYILVGTAAATPGWRLAMPRQEPVRHGIDDVQPCAAQAPQPTENGVDEAAQILGQMAAAILLQAAPLPFLGIELRTVLRQPQHMEPGRAGSKFALTLAAAMTGAIVQHQVNRSPRRRVVGIQRGQILGKAGRVLLRTQHLHAPLAVGRHTAEVGQPAIGAHRRQRRLGPPLMPHALQIRVGLYVRLIFILQFRLRGRCRELFPSGGRTGIRVLR